MQMLLDAILFGHEKHKGQFRRGTGAEYITHPIAVSYIVAAYKNSKRLVELLIAAILHDCLEDTDATYDELSHRFTPFVAALVQELSNDPVQMALLGKLEYQCQKLSTMTSYALVLKLADRLHNISDAPTPSMVRDTLELMRRLQAARSLSETHKSLMSKIVVICEENLAGTLAVVE